eukprot:6189541-Pleurochrysis_carterae.AAC.1
MLLQQTEVGHTTICPKKIWTRLAAEITLDCPSREPDLKSSFCHGNSALTMRALASCSPPSVQATIILRAKGLSSVRPCSESNPIEYCSSSLHPLRRTPVWPCRQPVNRGHLKQPGRAAITAI